MQKKTVAPRAEIRMYLNLDGSHDAALHNKNMSFSFTIEHALRCAALTNML